MQNIQQYQVANRFTWSTSIDDVGKTDAEVEEIRKKVEDVLKQAKRRQVSRSRQKYSEDPRHQDKGGDLGWIIRPNRPELRKPPSASTKAKFPTW